MKTFEIHKLDYYISSCGRFKSLEPGKDYIKSTKRVIISYDDDTNNYTAFLNEENGPIIVNKNKAILIEKFKYALEIAFAVSGLMSFTNK